MNEDISNFIDDKFPIDIGYEVVKSFNLFDSFNLRGHETDFIDLIVDESNIDAAVIADMFLSILNKKLNYIISQHGITLCDTNDIAFKNELLLGLLRLQSLESYEFCVTVISTEVSKVEKLCTILAEYTSISLYRYMDLIENATLSLLISIENLYSQHTSDDKPELNSELLKNIKDFFVIYDGEYFIREFARHATLGYEYSLYYPIIKEDIMSCEDIEEKAVNIIGSVLMAEDTYRVPINKCREIVRDISGDANEVTVLNSLIDKHLTNYYNLKKDMNEKK